MTYPAVNPPAVRMTGGYQGTLAAATGFAKFYNDEGRTLWFGSIRVSVGSAPTGASIVVDVKKNGTSIFTTTANRPTILAGQTTGLSGTPDVQSLAPGEFLTFDIVSVGTTPGSDLVVNARYV